MAIGAIPDSTPFKRVTQSKNIIRALLQTVDLKMLIGKNAWTQKGIDYLRSLATTSFVSIINAFVPKL